MEDSLEKQQNCSFPSTALGMQKNSHMIGKVKPKIRIIHIFAPEIIKTDVANFRELVQRLTGKPTDEMPRRTSPPNKKRSRNANNVPAATKHDHDHHPRNSLSTSSSFGTGPNNLMMIQRQPLVDLKGEDQEIWRNANSGGGFLGGFTELGGFMEQLNHHQIQDFPNLDQAVHHHQQAHHLHMDAFGQSLQLA